MNMENNKLLIVGLIGIVIIVVGAFFFVRTKQELPTKEIKKCGDGVCGDVEKTKGTCPQDCSYKTDETSIVNAAYSFGIHPSSLNDYAYAKDLGLDFNREGTYFIWSWSDINKNGKIRFKGAAAPARPDRSGSGVTINYDNEQEKLLKNTGIEVIHNVCPFFNSAGELENVDEQGIYQEYVNKMAERYDGDSDLGCTQRAPDCYSSGDNEYPSQSLITMLQANPVKYWQVCNHVSDGCIGSECKINNNYAAKYAKVQELTYLGVKASCPECQVLIAGDSGKDEYPSVYKALGGKYVDIIDKHFFGEAKDYSKIQDETAYLKNNLRSSGFDVNKLKFWITEAGTYAGAPAGAPGKAALPYQSESQQAQGLIKRYAVAFGEGIEKVLWAWGIEEGFGCECCQFDYTGLIYDGNREPQMCDDNDPYDRGAGVKKLAYYSLKLMIDKLGGFDDIEKIESSGNYVYKFTKNGKPIYVAWNDNGGSVTLKNIKADSVIITESVPGADSGADLNENDYPNFFTTKTKSASGGAVTIDLNGFPVFIEAQ